MDPIKVESAGGGYDVRVEPGARAQLAALVSPSAPSGRCVLISDETVNGLWGDEVEATLAAGGLDVTRLAFPAGEIHKTRKTWATLTDQVLDEGHGRDSCVVALGGGVVGDVAGFVAATYMRGIPVVQVPTTTLAMIDASVGGKTGVDHRSGKNLVGAFHPPAVVVADPEFLSTLSRPLRAQGFAEALKHGLILDRAHAEDVQGRAEALLTGDADTVAPLVHRSAGLKASVVAADERESGYREILNFGHTVAHALELAEDFTLPHGHAVAIGMVAEARIGEALGITVAGTADLIAEWVQALELPAHYAGTATAGELAGHAQHDKKNRRGSVRMVFLSEAGSVSGDGGWSTAVPGEDLERLFQECVVQ